jgi:hypothetical protein
MIIQGRYVLRNGIPRLIYIEPGWSLADIASVEDCDRAQAMLAKAIRTIEKSIKDAEAMPAGLVDRNWIHRATMALKFRRAALAEVEKIRVELIGNTAAEAF